MTSLKIKKGYVDLPEGQVHYQYTSSLGSKPPIIFLHKSASSSASYSTLQEYYSKLNHPTYAPDLPGFGQSFNPSPTSQSPLTTAWYCSILSSFITALNLKTYHLVGHHSGACLALELAVMHPSSSVSLSLIGPTLMSASERLEMKGRYYAHFNQPIPSGAHLVATWEYLRRMGCNPDTEEGLEMMQRELLDHARAWRGRQMIYGAVWEQDGQELLRNVRCKVLCLCAKDDVLWPYYHWVGELRRDVRTEIVGGANFECELDVKGVTEAIDSFLEG